MLMPTLPPRLRIRLRIAVPWVRMWRGRVDNAMMFRGTWVQPRPKPCSSPEMTIGAMPISSENWLICHIDTAVSRRPNRMISRLSTRLISGATRNIATDQGGLVSMLINDLADVDNEVFLFLDDYHLVTDPAIRRAVSFLVRHAPSH